VVAVMSEGWVPTAEALETSRVAAFTRELGFARFDELLAASVDDPAWFWDAAVRHLGLPFSAPHHTVVDDSAGIAWAKWFVGGRTNLARMCVDRWLTESPVRPAVEWHGEDGSRRTWTFGELHEEAEGLCAFLRERGVGAGDRVALLMPMVPEAVAAILAVAKLGAVSVPLFSGFGVDAVRARLEDASVAAIVTADGTLRRGGRVAMARTALDAADQVPSVHTVVVTARLGGLNEAARPGLDVVSWPGPLSGPSTTVDVPTDHPLLLAYTSGTTARPKGAVHVHGGLPVKVAAEGAFQHDLGPSDTLLWFSDMGWIMGPYQITAALANGATLCLVEGAPDHPGPDRLWRIVAESGVTVLGLSPTLVRALMPHGEAMVRRHDLSSLRILGSTGEPWNETPWQWYFDVVGGRRCPIINMSGGTEVGGALLSPHPVQCIRPGSLVGPALGIAVDVFDAGGRPVRDQVGELVCTKPWPGMTQGLHGDPQRYLETYWSRWPDTWVQGDLASVADGYWYLHGRSDDTIMIAGKRLGPIEPESALVSHPAVVEAAAVGIPDDLKGESLQVFVVLRDGALAGTPELAVELRELVASMLGSSFRPSSVVFVDQLPKTRSGKVMRRLVRAAALGSELGDLASLDDPAALEAVQRAIAGGDSPT
jgi:acetyl-CoA synthetase